MAVCEIAQVGPAHRLPRGSDEATVTCPTCGHGWTTSERNRRRIEAGELHATCKGCKRPALKITESHRRYWLLMFGADLRGRTASEYVLEEGLPAGLAELVVDLEDVLGMAA